MNVRTIFDECALHMPEASRANFQPVHRRDSALSVAASNYNESPDAALVQEYAASNPEHAEQVEDTLGAIFAANGSGALIKLLQATWTPSESKHDVLPGTVNPHVWQSVSTDPTEFAVRPACLLLHAPALDVICCPKAPQIIVHLCSSTFPCQQHSQLVLEDYRVHECLRHP